MRTLIDPQYLAFPLRIGKSGGVTSQRREHVREQIEQVLYTNPGERYYRPEFGAGLLSRVFEANNESLQEDTRQHLASSLVEALKGEVDPKTLAIETYSETEILYIKVTYQLATIGKWESHTLSVGGGKDNG